MASLTCNGVPVRQIDPRADLPGSMAKVIKAADWLSKHADSGLLRVEISRKGILIEVPPSPLLYKRLGVAEGGWTKRIVTGAWARMTYTARCKDVSIQWEVVCLIH